MLDSHSDNAAPASDVRSRLLPIDPDTIMHDEGVAYRIDLPDGTPDGDRSDEPSRSLLRLFEDGVELLPGHAAHSDVRRIGLGRHSHWGRQLLFSTSDNRSPKLAGRHYHVMIPGEMSGARGSTKLRVAAGMDFAAMSDVERFWLAREVYREVWPNSCLPDFGRSIDLDDAFAADFARVSPEADFSYDRKYNVDQLFALTATVEGDVAECGTYKGASAFFMARHIKAGRLPKRLCLFDSFEGVSTPGADDGTWWQEGFMRSTIDEVQAALAPLDVDFVDIFQGWIPARFAEVADRRFSFVHIDVDLHDPTHDSMAFFYPRLSPGGLIVLDDYGYVSCPGVTKAVDAFMADKPEPIVNLSAGGAFIMKAHVR